MQTNPVLEEIWRIKDDLAREAGDDIHQLCENTRKWAAEHPRNGPVVRTTAELRQLADARERERSGTSNLILNDRPLTDEQLH